MQEPAMQGFGADFITVFTGLRAGCELRGPRAPGRPASSSTLPLSLLKGRGKSSSSNKKS